MLWTNVCTKKTARPLRGQAAVPSNALLALHFDCSRVHSCERSDDVGGPLSCCGGSFPLQEYSTIAMVKQTMTFNRNSLKGFMNVPDGSILKKKA